MPDRFFEHPAMVLVITNLNYRDTPGLMPTGENGAADLNWQVVRLEGNFAYEFGEQIDALGPLLDEGWATKPSPKTGNPTYVRPSVLVVYREDYEFLLDDIVPRVGETRRGYDFILASQPWRARMPAGLGAHEECVQEAVAGRFRGRVARELRRHHHRDGTAAEDALEDLVEDEPVEGGALAGDDAAHHVVQVDGERDVDAPQLGLLELAQARRTLPEPESGVATAAAAPDGEGRSSFR